ncbi:5-carboxymethyl-2-hydroxymuconate isomerase [Breoghania corrubedonensis]|uniref:5-carboxymethyl-2-hydroxymuconate isomerase n=1 Tax=Breoghania corrubedonensis TaxID=665038 RepID=A0A2T5V541_9HYPH|nr:5-carboxymethyl-2-hydroxymuconate Delta-isomerase [Breoghania corrubedonensis]PTW58871.1 5-carboxymethyl-2-hydroxymuconate isomerase [Breoghania corrubedonensis]
MPHFSIEYSANLDRRVDMAGLCEEIRKAMLATGAFEAGAVRVRAVRCEAYAIADGLRQNAFIDMALRMAPRPQDVQKNVGDKVFSVAETYLAPLFETPHFALSLEIREIGRPLSWRRNAMHARLRDES